MNPIPMLPRPRKVRFVPRNSLHSIPAIRSITWRRGAGDVVPADDTYGGTGTKQSASTGGSLGGGLPSPQDFSGSSQVIVTSPNGVNLRAQPNTNAQVIAGEPVGTILQIVGQAQNGFLNVQDPQGRVGWVYSAYVADASQGQGTVSPPADQSGLAQASATPLGVSASAGGIVGLLVVSGLVVGAYYLLVK